MHFHIAGALFALISACLWAVSAFMFSHIGHHISARALNLAKGVIALLCLVLLVLPQGFPTVAWNHMIALALSGIIGICIGDTLYFLALKRLGARLTLLLGNLIPIITALMAMLIFNERISNSAWLGVMLVIFGVTIALWYRQPESEGTGIRRFGVIFGILFVFSEACGIIFTKYGVSDIDAMEATFIRQIWGVVCLSSWALVTRSLAAWMKPVWHPVRFKVLFIAAILGAFLGTFFSVLALKNTHVAIAATLNATSPLFALFISYFVLKKKVNRREIFAVLIATIGVGIYFGGL